MRFKRLVNKATGYQVKSPLSSRVVFYLPLIKISIDNKVLYYAPQWNIKSGVMMYLNDMDIQKQLTDEITQFLKTENLSFNRLKALLVSKKPIPEIQQKIAKTLFDLKNDEQKNLSAEITDEAKRIQMLNEQCDSLFEKAQQLNYSIFCEELQIKLNKELLNTAETKALQSVLRSMKDHASQVEQTGRLQNQLTKVMDNLASRTRDLTEIMSNNSRTLKYYNPSYKHLADKNRELTADTYKRADLIRMSNDDNLDLWITGSLIASIPLIFSVVGIIIATSPALLLTACILSIIFGGIFSPLAGVSLGKFIDYFIIKFNLSAIDKNSNQTSKNNDEMKELEKQSILTLGKEIKTCETTKQGLLDLIQNSKEKEEQLLQNAQEIQPSVPSKVNLLFFAAERNNHSTQNTVLESATQQPDESTNVVSF